MRARVFALPACSLPPPLPLFLSRQGAPPSASSRGSRASPARAGAGAAPDGANVSARAFAAMLKEMADRLEEFQAEMTPKAEAHMGSEAGFEAYQVRRRRFYYFLPSSTLL